MRLSIGVLVFILKSYSVGILGGYIFLNSCFAPTVSQIMITEKMIAALFWFSTGNFDISVAKRYKVKMRKPM
jgi:hypothetical protein